MLFNQFNDRKKSIKWLIDCQCGVDDIRSNIVLFVTLDNHTTG
jgi:hypothetical protein